MSAKKLYKYCIYIINLPIYWLSYIYPKRKDVWVFGSWLGSNYSDNPKYLYEYIYNHEKGIRPIWLTQNKKVFKDLRKKGYKAYMSYSILGYYYSIIASVGVYAVSVWDLNIFTLGRTKLINLWHGTPLKKILYDDKITYKRPHPLASFFFPFIKKEPHLITASSPIVQKHLASAFQIPLSNVCITGYPRNDVFFKNKARQNNTSKLIEDYKSKGLKIGLYMPTHRNEGNSSLGQILIENTKQANSFFEKNNIVLLVKLHFYELQKFKSNPNASNIAFLKNEDIDNDIYSIINDSDFLITDYSSVFFDYLLSHKPILFFPFDIDEYLKKDRELYYDYASITPGNKAYNWDELLALISETLGDKSSWKDGRIKINTMFNTFQDGNNSKRVYEQILKL